mmetsp:Transcript_4406/g.11755  ORF Transcript_4406/g.11755 Transcript_4406/m.11755 type:complete len:246 (-) Transcript_4406:108-845(-)
MWRLCPRLLHEETIQHSDRHDEFVLAPDVGLDKEPRLLGRHEDDSALPVLLRQLAKRGCLCHLGGIRGSFGHGGVDAGGGDLLLVISAFHSQILENEVKADARLRPLARLEVDPSSLSAVLHARPHKSAGAALHIDLGLGHLLRIQVPVEAQVRYPLAQDGERRLADAVLCALLQLVLARINVIRLVAPQECLHLRLEGLLAAAGLVRLKPLFSLADLLRVDANALRVGDDLAEVGRLAAREAFG